MFDIPSELDNEFGDMTTVFSRITVLPELEEEHFTAERHFDDRRRGGGQRGSSWKPSYGDGWQRQMPYQAGRRNSGLSQRFSSSSYWKNQASRGSRDKLWDSDDD